MLTGFCIALLITLCAGWTVGVIRTVTKED